jgi:hypothetical protein
MVSRITLCVTNFPSQELHILREILMHRYGREFSIAVMENRNGCVSTRVSLAYKEYYFRLLNMVSR